MKNLFIACASLILVSFILPPSGFLKSKTIYDFKVDGLSGGSIDFSKFKGKKILVVNTASECGLTPQYKQLEELYEAYKDKNFVIVGFPSNSFKRQEKGSNSEIKAFCERNYGVTFLMMEKINVKGDTINPIYNWLTHKKLNGVKNSRVKWNFQKYMINENGELVNYVNPWRSPKCRKIKKWLNK